MKKQLLYFSMVGMLLTMNACDDDGKTEFLDDYSTIMYFTNSGIQNVECLKVGEPTTYNIAVYPSKTTAVYFCYQKPHRLFIITPQYLKLYLNIPLIIVNPRKIC